MDKKANQGTEISISKPETTHTPRVRALTEAFSQNRLAAAGMVIFVLFFITAVAGVFLTSGTDPVFDPATVRLQEKLRPPLSLPSVEILRPEEIPPFGRYIFGTDDLGRDIFSRMLQGAWVSLTVGFVAVGISVLVGIFLGGIAGYFGQIAISLGHILAVCLAAAAAVSLVSGFLPVGLVLAAAAALWMWACLKSGKGVPVSRTGTTILDRGMISVDTLIMRLVDIMLCFPSFFLILTVVALLPASIYNIMIVIGLTSWMGAARFVRAEFLSLREQDFVTAAKALGVNDMRIIFRHIMPNAIAPVLVSATIGIATAILTEAGLSFLGFGVPPPHATWGNILSDGKRFIFDAPWLTFIPGISILIVVLCFNLFGEGLRDAFNPKLKER
ncbi:MAG: ABC transporter permease [Desulfatiglandaceae bacterium]